MAKPKLQGLLFLLALHAFNSGLAAPWILNNPYPESESKERIYYSSFSEQPKTLDPARSYSSNEYVFISQIYEPLLEYDYLARPYLLKPLTATQLPTIRYLDAQRNPMILEGENWYIEADAISKLGNSVVRRSGHTAFSYYIPSATLLSVKKTRSNPLTFVANLEVATASRYVLQSVLYTKINQDSPKAIETAQVAQWLEPGVHEMQFTFDNSHKLAEDSLLLGYLHLTDYGQLKTVYTYNQPIRLTKLLDK